MTFEITLDKIKSLFLMGQTSKLEMVCSLFSKNKTEPINMIDIIVASTPIMVGSKKLNKSG